MRENLYYSIFTDNFCNGCLIATLFLARTNNANLIILRTWAISSIKSEEIYNSGHWENHTYHDSQGNEHSSSVYVYNTTAYNNAKNAASHALLEYNKLKEKYDEVHEIYLKIQNELEYLYSLQKAVHLSFEKLEEKQYAILNSSNSIRKEIENNYNQLSMVIKTLETYKKHDPYFGDRISISLLDFPVSGIGEYDYYRNVHYDKFAKDKISVSSEDLQSAQSRMGDLGAKVHSCVTELQIVLKMANGNVDEELFISIDRYLDLLNKYVKYFDMVSSSCYLTTKGMNDILFTYQTLNYKKGNYGD